MTKNKKQREFLYPQKISHHLLCPICHQVFQDPVRPACGHTFCYICIQNWAIFQKKCPICKKSVSTRKVQKDLIPSKMIDELDVKCLHPECKWVGIYSVLRAHQRTCQFKPRKNMELFMKQNNVEIQQLQQPYEQEVIIIEGKQCNSKPQIQIVDQQGVLIQESYYQVESIDSVQI